MFCACTNTREKQTVRMQETKNKTNDLILNGPTNIKYTYTRTMEDFIFVLFSDTSYAAGPRNRYLIDN